MGILAARLVRWCNGSTTPFGGVCHGSNPCRTANLAPEIGDFSDGRTDSAQKTGESEGNIKHWKAEVTIYVKKPAYPFYRIAYRVDGKRRLKSFRTYSDANKRKIATRATEGASGQNFFNYPSSVYAGQSFLESAFHDEEFFVIEAEQVENGGVPVGDADPVLDCGKAKFIG